MQSVSIRATTRIGLLPKLALGFALCAIIGLLVYCGFIKVNIKFLKSASS